jgi:hypothetical protein
MLEAKLALLARVMAARKDLLGRTEVEVIRKLGVPTRRDVVDIQWIGWGVEGQAQLWGDRGDRLRFDEWDIWLTPDRVIGVTPRSEELDRFLSDLSQ